MKKYNGFNIMVADNGYSVTASGKDSSTEHNYFNEHLVFKQKKQLINFIAKTCPEIKRGK